MKIHLLSDLHLEFGYQELPGGDVLILAGDICEVGTLVREFHQTKPHPRNPGHFFCSDFFDFEVPKYKQVFMVMGNHEHYHGRFDRTYDELCRVLPSNVKLLENEVVEHQGVMFMGATMWTDMNKFNDITLFSIKTIMNDYRVVKNHYKDRDLYYKLTPEHTAAVHVKTRNYFRETLAQHSDKPFVIITHHAPSFKSVPPQFVDDYHMNGAYASDLSELILDNPNIKFWVHGHMHDPVDYQIGDTRILSNPRGYLGYEDQSRFNSGFTFEVSSV